MSGFTDGRLRAAIVFVCLSTALQLGAAAPKARKQAPLRFDPPAAGPTQRSKAGYDACVDAGSPDGAAFDCQSLQRPATPAKPKPRPR